MAETTIAKAYVQIIPSTQGIKGSITQALGGEAESAGKSAGSVFSGAMGTALKVGTAAIGVATTATAAFVKTAVDGFGEYEQLVGGVETLFGDAADTVVNNANNAFQTAGMSANEYMETVTSFSASLLQSLDGDTEKAASAADTAIQDMSDNANKMGSSMESIQNAYQGFAKQNYTMLDNLKLGYGGTKSEMERLLSDAEKLSGIKYDINNLSDVYEAIHVVQTELGITGTTAKEASTTIQGSLSSMKAAWSNLATGIATDGADVQGLIETFVTSLSTFAGNIMPVIQTALTGVSTLISQLAPVIAEAIPTLVTSCLPALLQAGFDIISALGNAFITNLPIILETGMQIILQLATGIADALPTLIPTIVQVIITIVEYLLTNIDLLIDAAIQLMTGLAEGFVNAMPILIEKAPQIILALVNAIVTNVPKLVEASLKIMVTLATALITYLPQLLAKVPEILTQLKDKFFQLMNNLAPIGQKVTDTIKTAIQSAWSSLTGAVSGWVSNLKEAFLEKVQDFADVGKQIIEGIKNGIKDGWDSLKSYVGEVANSLLDAAKSALNIHSPSRAFADQVGKQIPAGIAMGIKNNMGVLLSAVDDMSNEALVNTSIGAVTSSSYDLAGESFGGASIGGGYNQTINVYSPQALTPSEVARQTRNATRNMVLALQGV